MEPLHISEDFFNEPDFKESDFPGIFPQLHYRKPNTPRRKISISSESPDKNKTKPQRRRSKSQCSQDGGDAQQLARVRKKSQSTDKDSQHQQQPIHRKSQEKKSQNSDVEMCIVKEEPQSPIKLVICDNEKTRQANNDTEQPNSSQKPRASKNITRELLETSEDSDDLNDTIGIKKNKRRKVRPIDSDEEIDQTASKVEIMQVTEKPGNEVEVDAYPTSSANDAGVHQSNDNGDDIFIPPVAAGSKSVTCVKIKREKPPSEIFIKELKKFIRNSIRSGCVSLAELKDVLSMKQKGLKNFSFLVLKKYFVKAVLTKHF